ncbi:FeoB-associated Cys-rich membrane protein [Vallitalea guaymasensis]|uniref:FeoB-associated Cys-rich membrane protein n=1 Tax=Vallitalea guaymasensis TaxID=1185412 RepID=A0A8J8MBU9_9FIRM|nr:FeoB-associated Cys-rich membrane protein [Vallitalea guaymasensis]QUH30092.1 FeoB-associated Cys-rich membrane protein [Vallitalea guaymasensis]
MGNFIAGGIIILLVGLAIYKMYKDKKAGKKCSGCSSCPAQSNCESKK